VPPWPETPPAPPGDSDRNESTELEDASPRNVYIHTPLPNAKFLDHDAYAKNRKHGKDCVPDLLTDHVPSNGWYTICCVLM
jgi:hypothetical protein